MEIVEHVEDIPEFINQSSKFLKVENNVYCNINQTLKSYIFAIIGANIFWDGSLEHTIGINLLTWKLENICNKNPLYKKNWWS